MKNKRLLFTQFLFDTLAKYEYVLLKFIEDSVFDVKESSDLDILIRAENFNSILTQLTDFQGVSRLSISRKTSMTQLFLQFEDGKFLQIDFLFKFIRTNLIYLDHEEIFKQKTKTKENIFTTSLPHLFEHVILFNFLNFAPIGQKYIVFFTQLPDNQQLTLLNDFNQKYKTNLLQIENLAKFDPNLREKIQKKVSQRSDNQGISKLRNNLFYFMDKASSFRQDRGIVLTFSGVDGAGKTTVMDNTERILKEKYKQKIVRLRHRPQILPILSAYKYGKSEAEKRAAETMPRTGGNKSGIGSVVRFFYYYLDYLLGQFVVYFKYTLRGYTVLYDRYYFDFIVDHRRSNIHINASIPKALYRFVFKPDLNIFLYASPEVILQRKKELPSDQIVQLTTDYKQLFEKLGAKSEKKQYLTIENIVLEETLETIENAVKRLL